MLSTIQLVSLDVDGVLASRSKIFSNTGWVASSYDSSDGLGIELLLLAGIQVVALTSSRHGIIEARAKSIPGLEIVSNRTDKGSALGELLERHQVSPPHALHAGDDIWDCSAFHRAGLGVAVNDAHPHVRKAADWITRAPGGAGAVREIADALLASRGLGVTELTAMHNQASSDPT